MILAGELMPAARLLDWLEVRLRELWRSSILGKGAVVAAAVVLATAVLYTAYWLLF